MNNTTLAVLSAVAILSGCAAPVAEAGGPSEEAASGLSGGVYIVGEDIEPGRYKSPAVDADNLQGCTWTVQENADPDSSTTDVGSGDGPQQTVVADGERFFVGGGCAFELVE